MLAESEVWRFQSVIRRYLNKARLTEGRPGWYEFLKRWSGGILYGISPRKTVEYGEHNQPITLFSRGRALSEYKSSHLPFLYATCPSMVETNHPSKRI